MAENIFGTVSFLFALGFMAIILASFWVVFEKADKPGWASLIPIYNTYVMLKIGDNPGWYLLLMFIPLVNLYAVGKMHLGIAKAFGKGIGWGAGLWLLPFVFYPMLGFGDASYLGHGGSGGSTGGQPSI